MKNVKLIILGLLISFNGTAQLNEEPFVRKSIIKYSPLDLIAGDLKFSFEQQLSRQSSIEIELGPTLSEVTGVELTPFDPDFLSGNVYSPSGILSERQTGLGFLASVGFRYYLLEGYDRLNGFYISPIFKHKVYNTTVSETNYTDVTAKSSKMISSFQFNFGVQIKTKTAFSVEFHAGFGLGYMTKNSSDLYQYEDNFGNEQFDWYKTKTTSLIPAVNVGIKMGLATRK